MSEMIEALGWIRIEGYVGYDWWKKMLLIHGTQQDVVRLGGRGRPDEYDYMISCKKRMLLQRIFNLTRFQCERKLSEDEIIDLGWVCFDTATDWIKVAERLDNYTAITEEELVRLVKFLEQTTNWLAEGDPSGWHRLAKPKTMYKIWDYYFTEPELIEAYLLGRLRIPLEENLPEVML